MENTPHIQGLIDLLDTYSHVYMTDNLSRHFHRQTAKYIRKDVEYTPLDMEQGVLCTVYGDVKYTLRDDVMTFEYSGMLRFNKEKLDRANDRMNTFFG